MKNKWLCVLMLGLITCLPGLAGADFISDAKNFGAGTVTEGFEEITPTTPNTTVASYGNFILLGTTSYNFWNGITLTAPQPPLNDWYNMGPYINNSTYATSPDLLNGYNEYASAPFGTAYLGIWEYGKSFSLTFTFAQDVMRAGAYFTGIPKFDSGSTYTVLALDEDGKILAQQAINTVSVADWKTNFVGFEGLTGFRQSANSFPIPAAAMAKLSLTTSWHSPSPCPPPSCSWGAASWAWDSWAGGGTKPADFLSLPVTRGGAVTVPPFFVGS